MKLKTLKDFGDSGEDRGMCGKYEIKQEAINWVKRNRKEDIKDGSNEAHVYFTGAELWIKHFFNITEEDLK